MTLTSAQIARLAKREDQHKYDHGHALILSGGAGQGGAARLAARSALRVGAGLVTLGCPPGALQENAAQLNAIMTRLVRGADDLKVLLEDARINAFCIGPGLGVSEVAAGLLATCLASGPAAVVDADALTLLGQDAALRQMLHGRVVLTPHAGEYARVFGQTALDRAALDSGAVVLLKGAKTQIAAADGRGATHDATGPNAVPWLATAGSGDVLAGLITGLLARGFDPFEAASVGASLHGAAGRALGPGLIAEDLPEALPGVFRDLGL